MHQTKGYSKFVLQLAQLVVFSALFFVQLQVKFIASAYNDFSATTFSTSSVRPAPVQAFINQKENNSNKQGYTKLNKRYQSASVFTLLAVPVIIKPVCLIAAVRSFYTKHFCHQNPFGAQLLRGPPSRS